MVDLLQSSTRNMFNTAVWAVKIGFLSIGFVSTLLLLKHSVPYSLNAVFSAIPQLWISFRCWLAPPYVYIVVNFIIIIIAASSSFQHKNWLKNSEEAVVAAAKPSDLGSDHEKTLTEIWPDLEEIPIESVEKALVSIEKSPVTWSDISCVTESNEEKTPALSVSSSFSAGKKMKTCRIIGESAAAPPRKAAKAPENDDETLDATWKMITEGKGKPLSRQLKKSETWDVSPRVDDPGSELDSFAGVTNRKELRKLETFKDGSSSSSSALMRAGRGGLTRDVSLSQDELNYRVEAFIKQFKLQRQESDHRYMEMVNRGVY